MSADHREPLLHDCVEAVRARGATYRRPSAHFEVTAALISAYLGDQLREPLRPDQWGVIMILDKVARSRGRRDHRDNWVDVAGYAACTWDVIAETLKAQDAPAAGTEADHARER